MRKLVVRLGARQRGRAGAVTSGSPETDNRKQKEVIEVTSADKSVSRKWEPIKTKPVLPNPAICRYESMGKPGVMKCLVDWPIYCIYAFKLNGDFLCAHKDRLKLAQAGQTGK